jgi:plastocyanin
MKRFLIGLALLTLVPALAQAASAPSITVVHIRDYSYKAPAVTIHTGDTVRFINDDNDAHTVTSSDGLFDSKGLDTNGVWEHTFAKAGTYHYFCELHPYMKGTIIVKDMSA